MSKFKKVKTNGDQNIVGDHNTQDNSKKVVVNHYHNNSEHSGDSDGGSALGIFIMIGVGVGMLIWKFYSNVDLVFHFLTIALLSSPLLIILAVSILYFKNELEQSDLIHFLYSLIVTAVFYYILNYSVNNISREMINLAHQTDGFGFFKGLSDYGEKLAYSNVLTVILISVSSFFNHLISLRKFTYSLSNINEKGFWYDLYSMLSSIKFERTFILIAFFALIIGLNIKGIIFDI